jgi:hypothetical protein
VSRTAEVGDRDFLLEALRDVKAACCGEWKEVTPRRFAVKAIRAVLGGFLIFSNVVDFATLNLSGINLQSDCSNCN